MSIYSVKFIHHTTLCTSEDYFKFTDGEYIYDSKANEVISLEKALSTLVNELSNRRARRREFAKMLLNMYESGGDVLSVEANSKFLVEHGYYSYEKYKNEYMGKDLDTIFDHDNIGGVDIIVFGKIGVQS